MKKHPVLALALTALAAAPASDALAAGAHAGPQESVQASVVKIHSTQSPPTFSRPWEITAPQSVTGSGVVIEGGLILTNAHVVQFSHEIYVQPYLSSDKLDATVEYIAADIDLAVLRLDDEELAATLKPVPIGTELPRLQQKVNVLGYPAGGDTLSITEGVVSRIEFEPYYFTTAAVRIQVDAAINPGNSGGPGIIDGEIAGLVFSRLSDGDNIGYLIPAEVIRHFLEDCTSDGTYDGFPSLDLGFATTENPTLRDYLGLDRETTGVVVSRVDHPDLEGLLQPWDVITSCDGVDVDNLGTITLADDQRLTWLHLATRKAPGSTVTLGVRRRGEALEVEAPTATHPDALVHRMTGERPTYFIYGGLSFTPATMEMITRLPAQWFAFLGGGGRMLTSRIKDGREQPGDELVVLSCPILPHKLTKGYDLSPLSVVTHVNDEPIRNLRQMVGLLKELQEEPYVVFRFENDREERIVLDPKEVAKAMPAILRNNNIAAACSDDLRDIWP